MLRLVALWRACTRRAAPVGGEGWGAVVSTCMQGGLALGEQHLMREAISMQSACNQHAISMQSTWSLSEQHLRWIGGCTAQASARGAHEGALEVFDAREEPLGTTRAQKHAQRSVHLRVRGG